jgi:hypothetical protein
MIETNVKNYKDFVVNTEQGTEKGIFFRSPIQKISFDAYYCDEKEKFSAWDYKEKIKNPFIRFLEILKGNKNIVDNINEWAESDNWGGFDANILCSPIYFWREYRRLTAESTSSNTNIKSIKSYGYESQYNRCGGSCMIEKTVFALKNNKKIKVLKPETYNYTYQHIIEKIIDSGCIV